MFDSSFAIREGLNRLISRTRPGSILWALGEDRRESYWKLYLGMFPPFGLLAILLQNTDGIFEVVPYYHLVLLYEKIFMGIPFLSAFFLLFSGILTYF